MITGGKRNVLVHGREPKHFRKVKLLSSGVEGGIDPSRWVQVQGAKQFDDKSTALLRVYKHKTEDKYLVHAMRAEVKGKKAEVIAEAHEMVVLAEAIPAVVSQVAKHCGVDKLIASLK